MIPFRYSRRVRPMFCQAASALVCLAGAHAATFVVTSADDPLGDDGKISLREAVDLANDNPGPDTITFSNGAGGSVNFHDAVPETIALVQGEIDLSTPVTIIGPGSAKLTISGSGISRIFDTANELSVISGLTLTNGKAVGGGAVFQEGGTLRLNGCVIRENDATTDSGGGLYLSSGTMELIDCQVRGNLAGDQGGGIVSAGGTLVLTRTSVEANECVLSDGGGIFALGTAVTLTDATVSGNEAGESGGGLRVLNGTLTVLRSRLENNTAGTYGGGITVEGTPASLTDSTASGNTANDEGGGIYASGESLTLLRSTLRQNSADGSGGGLFARETAVTLNQSTAEGNDAAGGGGGLYVVLGGLTLSESTVTDNTCEADSYGGGIYGYDLDLSLTGCTISGNKSGEDGGGIFAEECASTVLRSTISGNTASGLAGVGGGMAVCSGSAILTDSTVSGNLGLDGGAGIHSTTGLVTLQQCTLSGNNAATAESTGGALFAASGTVTLTHCTLSGNRANSGGGIYTEVVTLSLTNCILTDSTGLDVELDGTTLVLNGRTLVGTGIIRADGTATGTLVTDAAHLLVADPLLAPLGDYGGPTPTMALLPGSPARNAATGSTRTLDQRGFPLVGTADAGAYEAGTTSTNFNAFLVETNALPATAAQRLPEADYDLDGATNREEWLAGTSLTDPASFFRLLSFTRSGNTLQLTFPTVTGRQYLLESSPDLLQWNTLSTTPGNASVKSVSTPITGAAKQFLRIRVQP